jgi:transglutaminase-like putative cysteine protease
MSTIRHLAALAAVPLAASALSAQAPRITEAGDPSVRNDTVYRLAVKPADHPDESSIFLLDDGVVRLEADGTGERTYRYVAQVLTQEGVEGWGERTLSYDGTRQRLRLNWARVVDAATGRVISDKPSHDQESLAPVSMSSPVYSDQKLRRLSLGGVAPGTIVDISYTVESLKPVLPGDFLESWSVHTGRPTRRSRYVLDLPASLTPRLHERNLNFRRRERVTSGRRVYDWSTAEVPKVEGESFMADSNGVFMSIQIGGNTGWPEIARWYADLSRDRYALTPALEAKLAEVTGGARTREDSLRALHRWIAQDLRYVSLSLGIGGYQPRMPAAVLETQYGDCKDKATLFIALARRMGINAHPVLLSSGGGVDERFPSIHQFDHMIAAVEVPGRPGYTYLDLTSALTPFGAILPSYQGAFGLVVHPDGRGEPIKFPLDPPSANRSETRIVGELSADGTFRGNMTTSFAGALQYSLRNAFSAPLSAKDRDDVGRSVAANLFEGAKADSLELFDGRDLRTEARTRVWVSGGRAASASGGTLILTLPLGNGASSELIADLEAAPKPRRFPIDVSEVIGPLETVSELRLTLPEGYRARLPQGVRTSSAFGAYSAEYAQEGRELRVTKRISGTRGTLPPERIGELVTWLKEMGKDDVRFVVLEK